LVQPDLGRAGGTLNPGVLSYPYLDMELTKKTTILFPPDLFARLARLAQQEHTSIGELVRTACVRQYGLRASGDTLSAVRELAGLQLPVGTPQEMEAESVPPIEDLP